MYSYPETPPQEPNTAASESPKQIDPHNPFDNALENPDYRPDYRKILPQILLPGYEIPLRPEYGERRALRRCINTGGLMALAGCILSQIIFTLLMFIILALMGYSPIDYLTGQNAEAADFFENSSLAIGLNALVFTVLNVTIALTGCRIMKTPVQSLFRTKDFSIGKAARYAVTGISLQCVAGIAYNILEFLLSNAGTKLGQMDTSYTSSPKSIIMMVLYMCILAPITEELLFRGFLMKTLSRVGTRFAIVISAMLFGLMHGNIAQMLLGFLVGLYLGKIDVRHNSLLPSIIVHMAINVNAVIITLAEEFSDTIAGSIFLTMFALLYYAAAILGLIFWFWKERKEPLPYPTQKQAFRSRLFWSSPLMLAAFAVEILILFANEAAMMSYF